MRRLGKIRGAQRHRWFNRLLEAEVRTGGDLRSWMRLSFPALNVSQWDDCRKQADEFLETGVDLFRWDAGRELSLTGDSIPETRDRQGGSPLTGDPGPVARDLLASCPAVLFGKGGSCPDPPLFAVFNSRKPRLVSPDSNWLVALRFFFRSLDPRQIALAGSTGTLTYDMAGTLALRSGLSQLLVAPFPLLKADRELLKVYGEGARGIPVLSCMLDAVTCPEKQAPICRDRIVALLANFHLVLEIRSRGNLLAVLEEIQAKSPRPQFVLRPEKSSSSNSGNYTLLTKFPEHACVFGFPVSPRPAAAGPVQTASFFASSHAGNSKCPDCDPPPHLRFIPWGDYLFHYTRACPGPWPGETRHGYLVNLLDARPLSGHSALETLIRILQEGLIRAGSRMVRGGAEVVSWSSHPPHELFLMRRWNRALVRWTVEPYGVAVRRDVLRSLGAKPAVYGAERVYSRLAEYERYRFQLSRSSPSASWRHEREWRLRGDLALSETFLTRHLRIARRQTPRAASRPGFVFVQTREEKAMLCAHVNTELPIVVLNP